jgi:copper homeostasis protein
MPTASEGNNVIKHMVGLGRTFRHCQIMAGSGITQENALDIIKETGVKQIHLGSGVRTNGKLDKAKFDQLLASI